MDNYACSQQVFEFWDRLMSLNKTMSVTSHFIYITITTVIRSTLTPQYCFLHVNPLRHHPYYHTRSDCTHGTNLVSFISGEFQQS